MKKRQLILSSLILGIIMIALASCEQSDPLSTDQDVQFKKDRTLSLTSLASTSDAGNTLLMVDDGVARFHKNYGQYFGLEIGHYSGSALWINNWSLTPPEGWENGSNVTITMTVEKTGNELIHTFGPHGSTFEPGATLYLSWEMLGTDTASLFYIDDNGEYIEQQADDVDYENKWFKITIHHFSRYAVAYGR